ncbi:nucleotide-diphospho-sugar transferase [Kickxella alabastrina]|uniref:nucleotide-diphospho-sugar transferase n=1 Tax=Kickxella alabastrina TaxID=61397 RepID=UPI00221EDC4E|nr:nucleotide-diphospho-sugar transferase [Kickxella alabastrina]KAI7834318.1 nucleotide-diphospho-sugar transferase [Kickxella alabastrina]
MAPGKGNKQEKAAAAQSNVLVAIVLADSFDDLFQPLSFNKPRCLLPLCNVPMIEYTLDFLASSGVKETVVVCKSHSQAIEAYIKQSKWMRAHSPMKIKITIVRKPNSLGEALCEIDDTPFVSDFILCTGVVISNMDLSQLVKAHMANKHKDPEQVMTMLLQEATPSHRLRDKSEESVYVINPRTNRLFSLDSVSSLPKTNELDIPISVITDNPEVEIRADLIDTNVYICSPLVFSMFRDNSDYQTVRRDFIHSISTSPLESGILNHDLAYVSHSGYTAGVIDTSSYDAISRDLIARWAYPLCPDSNPADETAYSYNRGAVYKADSVVLGRESRVEHHVMLGSNSHVADFAQVSDSVLGTSCRIGEFATVRGSHLFNEAKIGKGSVVERSIIGERVNILDNVFVERGCIIGDDVTIGPNVRVPEFTRIARWLPQENGDDSSDSENYASSDDESGLDSDSDSDEGNGKGTRNTRTSGSADERPTAASAAAPGTTGNALELESFDLNLHELRQSIKCSFERDYDVGVAGFEINNLRFTFNGSQEDIRRIVTQEILKSIDVSALPGSAEHVVSRWGELIKRTVSSNLEQVNVVDIVERFCALDRSLEESVRSRLFLLVLRFMYELDIVEDMAIVYWYNKASEKADGDDVSQDLVQKIATFVEWLEESSSEDEEGEDSGSDEDEDSD